MEKSKKHIVILSYYFPPTNHVASRRSYAFYKYLDKTKYDVSIVTAAKSDLENAHYVDPNKGLKRRKTTTKYFLLNKFNALCNLILMRLILDENKGWTNSLNGQLESINRSRKIDVLVSSFAPVSTLIAGLKFKNKYPDVKWVLDMRDELSTSPFVSEGRRASLQKLENQCLQKAEALISVSKPIVDEFVCLSQKLNTQLLFSEIRNGYDFEINESYLKTHNKKFTLSYLGSFYGSRKPNNLFKALGELIKEGEINKEDLVINIWSAAKSYVVPSGLIDNVFNLSSVSEEDSISNMQNSDALLLIHPANGAKGVFTGKLFEYLGSCRPVLALVDTDDVAAQLIVELNAGWVAPNEDIGKVKESILAAYKFWLNQEDYTPDSKGIETLHRKFQVEKFENEILNRLKF